MSSTVSDDRGAVFQRRALLRTIPIPNMVVRSIENRPNGVFAVAKCMVERCRCGHSSKRPECDGTRKKVESKAPKTEASLFE